ncbi:leucine zipper protein 1 [Entelurus aequoreus]|uniref:leucine zipper protein 1 n=1 Tax=Entelurus aequoreus TaxID=161455 RepID=UPI002B1D96F0|nr:leucine zipper protein 1 [Entelurus aequoreus]XP_061897456.1 leucine zipper protein 1 [Entelurus aequoreus]XP_061897457.1 leucine zipper protein 1 [Entelurus aequoreus]XP_061897459.1 leucine zipper protein 1 [Entelurus aequoreus]XP_061897460.1 leucine zipper protein 1 [Entelurus aequoreus]
MSDMTHRHLRHKLQSVVRRLDELEEATNKLQKSEDELLDIQDKIIQAEGSNSSLLGDVEALRKRLLKIQGKDEEVRKAEDLCRTVREKLEEEENLTKELKAELEHLQGRMAELEILEEAFGKSKSDCTQLCLSLNEEKNVTKKLSTELEALKARLKEMEASEIKLDKAEQALTAELDKLKGFYQTIENEHERILEKQRQDEKVTLKLMEKLEQQNNCFDMAVDPGCADLMRSRIEDGLSSTGIFSGHNKSLDYNMGLLNKSENQKNSGLAGSQEEDNKVKELTQEVERLKNRLKQLEIVEEDLKNSESKNGELQEKFQMERKRALQLSKQVEQLNTRLCSKGGIGGNGTSNVDKQGNGSANISPGNHAKYLENGKAGNEEIAMGGFKQEIQKYHSASTVTELSSTPFQESTKAPKIPNTRFLSDNGIKESTRGNEEKGYRRNTPCSDIKKVSVLHRYPPAANDKKLLKTAHRQTEGESNTFSKLYVRSESQSNNSDVVSESCALKDTEPISDQELTEKVQDPVPVTSKLSKANETYRVYRSNVHQLLPNDQGSESHSSASETESTGSRPSEPETVNETTTTTSSSRTATSQYSRYPHVKDSHSEGSSSQSSFDEELHMKTNVAEGGISTSLGIEIQRTCSPREALISKGVIKSAIVESDRKEVMTSEPLAANGKPKISTKPILTTSIKTIYPNDPNSSRTSSRSSSVSSESVSAKERHTSTTNIVIGPSSISIPYEISIRKSEITMRPNQDQVFGADNLNDSSKSKYHNTSTVEMTTSQVYNSNSRVLKDTKSGIDTFTSSKNQRQRNRQPQEERLHEDMKNVTVRKTWKNQVNPNVDEKGRGGRRVTMEGGGSEDETETTTTWKAYLATTIDSEDTVSLGPRTGGNNSATKGVKLSPAEMYKCKIDKDAEEPVLHRGESTKEPLGRKIPHAPVTSQSWSRSVSQRSPGPNRGDRSPIPSLNQVSWKPHPSSTNSLPTGSSYDRTTKTPTSSGEQWATRGHGSTAKTEGKAGPAASRLWSHRQAEHH